MNILLIFFALPIATIIISIAFQKIFKCPILVAAIIFAIFLIVTFVVSNIYFLIATIVYTIISLITAYIVWIIQYICRGKRNTSCRDNCQRGSERNEVELLSIQGRCGNGNNGNLLTISSGCNGCQNDLLTIQSNVNSSNNCCSNDTHQNCNCSNCGCSNDTFSSDPFTISTFSNGTSSSNCGGCSCDCDNQCSGNNNQRISVQARVVPNPNNNTTGRFTGCYQRRR